MGRLLHSRWGITLRVVPIALAVVLVKYGLHRAGWEVISLSPLLSGLLAATVFLIGFLISGVLSDYKESERLPAELATSLEALFDEGLVTRRSKGEVADPYLRDVAALAESTEAWFRGRQQTGEVMERLSRLNEHFAAFEPLMQPAFIGRMKQEQTQVRRLVARAGTIRDTSFIQSGYVIAELISGLLIVGLLLSKITPFYESLFFVGLITFLLSYMLRLLHDLDNPFEYAETGGDADEVSLRPIEEALERMRARLRA